MGLSVWPVPFGLANATRPAPPNAIASAKVCCRGPVPPPAGKNSWGGVDPSSRLLALQHLALKQWQKTCVERAEISLRRCIRALDTWTVRSVCRSFC
jgi:hypothetical protein